MELNLKDSPLEAKIRQVIEQQLQNYVDATYANSGASEYSQAATAYNNHIQNYYIPLEQDFFNFTKTYDDFVSTYTSFFTTLRNNLSGSFNKLFADSVRYVTAFNTMTDMFNGLNSSNNDNSKTEVSYMNQIAQKRGVDLGIDINHYISPEGEFTADKIDHGSDISVTDYQISNPDQYKISFTPSYQPPA